MSRFSTMNTRGPDNAATTRSLRSAVESCLSRPEEHRRDDQRHLAVPGAQAPMPEAA